MRCRDSDFERWFASYCGIKPEAVYYMWREGTYVHYKWNVEIAWAAWQAGQGRIARMFS